MSKHWHKLIYLGPHGEKLNKLQLEVGEIIKIGGMLHFSGKDGSQHCELIPRIPKGGLPANLKLRYTLYALAFSTTYGLNTEADPSTKVADEAWSVCEKIQLNEPGYLIPKSYDARKRDAIVHLATRPRAKILADKFGQIFIDPQNVLRFVKENRDTLKRRK